MKSLLISLMAFLCALGVYAAPTGTGTEEDPYVIADGDTYVIPGGATVYSSFTAPSKGTLKLYGAQNEAYMSRSAEKWVRGLCFNELGVCS